MKELSMTDDQLYFEYLKTRSHLGSMYRRLCLYPRISKRLRGRALDIGCGIGDMLAHRPDTLGVDINPRTVEYCRSLGLPASQMAVDHVPHADQDFDSVLLDNVLEHITDPNTILGEVHRVLRPSGRLVVGVPGRKGWDSDPDHKVFYDEATLRATIEVKGFTWEETFFTPMWESEWLGRVIRSYCVYGVFRQRQ